ncbi:MAG: CsgG/HfaB family protein [Desulfuromonadaceae bacterium]|nr:CsgG/HfaB family protein [Desulfuromonadaceae bacterium]MDD2848230.1 CsgG/HfaB family protein [Desulfuromonadaceae bacterium]MDD4130603.1 CsgG/HfaB family protein [Desulfuromonadaceae bacterium]
MKLIIYPVILCITLSGCSLFSTQPDPKKVALMPFYYSTPGKSIGQEVADRVALELILNGYTVIDSSTTTALINEVKFYNLGLSDDMRAALKEHNIGAVVFGSVNDFACESIRTPSQTGSLVFNVDKKNRCTVSLTAKIADTATGRLLWGVTMNDTSEGADLTAMTLMKSLISKAEIRNSIPMNLKSKQL